MKATKILLTAMFAFISGMTVNAAVENYGAGTRVDYINAKGERVMSKTVELNDMLFAVDSYGYVGTSQTGIVDEPDTIRFVPWGTENYDVNIDTEVPIEYYVKSSKKEKPRRLKANNQSNLNVLCGDTIMVIMELPDNAYPELNLLGEYTDVLNGQQYWYPVSKVPFSTLYGFFSSPQDLTNPFYMNMDVPYWVEGTPYIYRLPANDKCNNRWCYEFVMPNEPYLVKIGYGYADSKQLTNTVHKILYGTLYTQHDGLNYFFNNGEHWIMRFIGEGMSADQINGSVLYANWETIYGMTSMLESNSYFTAIPWANYYCGIMLSNMLLDNLGLFTNVTETERNIAKAQLLSLRAHCYTRILQIFGKRWSESDDGTAFCAPLILSINDFQKPLATMADIKKQCENDLNEAIRIFDDANYKHSTLIEPDLNVARGLLMRLALWTNDWQTARDMSRQLLADVPLSTNQDMLSGFYTRTNSWIWGASTYVDENAPFDPQIYYWAPQNFDACNGTYGQYWNLGPNAIDRDLWLKIPEKDMRRNLFVMPEHTPTTRLKNIENWYKSSSYSDVNKMFLQESQRIANAYKIRRPEANAFINDNKNLNVPYGAQLKFWGTGEYCSYDQSNKDGGALFMRSDEALLTQAEACWHLGDEATARTLLTNLNSMRNEEYSCTATGQNLLDEIRLYRRIELWGEGFSWFDQKRWNLPISRNLWVEGDTTSGNWPSIVPATVETSAANGWRAVIPSYYIKQNPNIDISKMGYVEATGYDEQQPATNENPAKVSKNGISKDLMPLMKMQTTMSK